MNDYRVARRRIDHVVMAVHDLEAASHFYQQLGFQVGARNRHSWGTENRLIQFRTSFIELISVGSDPEDIPPHKDRQFSFGGFVCDYLRAREGLAMVALDSPNATADAALFAQSGIGSFEPFFFERKGRRPDGEETHVAFTLAFAADNLAPHAGFFVCQQHFPENFWNPTFQCHENGATDISVVGMTATFPASHEAFLSSFTGSTARSEINGGLSFDVQGGRLKLLQSSKVSDSQLTLSFVSIPLENIEAEIERLNLAGIPFEKTKHGIDIPPKVAFGCSIRFEKLCDNERIRSC